MRKNGNPFWPQKSILHPKPPKPVYEPVRRIRMTLTREEQHIVDSVAARHFSLPISILMEHAGIAVADACMSLAGAKTTPIHVFAGKGNNGGDAYVCARILYGRGFPVTIWDCFTDTNHTGAIRTNREACIALGIRIRPCEEFNPNVWAGGVSRMMDDEMPGMPCVIVDGIIGTGYDAKRALPFRLRSITRSIEEGHVRGARVLSIDIPTGVDANTGETDASAVRADMTVTFILPKHGMTIGRGPAFSGQIRVSTIGLPINFADIALSAGANQ